MIKAGIISPVGKSLSLNIRNPIAKSIIPPTALKSSIITGVV
jgi:hypothetical protein